MVGVLVVVCASVIVAYVFYWYRYSKFIFSDKCKCTTPMEGKTVIITGANSGIGKETARNLARRGARVLLACRNITAAEETKEDIIQTTANKNIEVRKLDLSSQNSIRKFATEIIRTESRLDVLIHNAGILEGRRQRTVDGLDVTLATNYYGPFLLTHLLIDLMKHSAPSRIVVVSSTTYSCSSLNFEMLLPPSSIFYTPIYLYSFSKLLQIYFTVELARRLKNAGVTVNALHPGVVATGIAKTMLPFGLNMLSELFLSPLGISTEMGCQTSVHVAVSEELEKTSGKFFMSCKEYDTELDFSDQDKLTKLWEISKSNCGWEEGDTVI